MRKLVILLTALFLLGLTISPVSAQGPDSYRSTVTVTNVSETPGTINLIFYNSDGTVADDSIIDPIDALETKFYTTFPVSTGFEGSLIIQSDVPLATSSTVIGVSGSPINYASYVGVSGGSNMVYLPLLMDENDGFNTFYSVQNTSTSVISAFATPPTPPTLFFLLTLFLSGRDTFWQGG